MPGAACASASAALLGMDAGVGVFVCRLGSSLCCVACNGSTLWGDFLLFTFLVLRFASLLPVLVPLHVASLLELARLLILAAPFGLHCMRYSNSKCCLLFTELVLCLDYIAATPQLACRCAVVAGFECGVSLLW
jgi:hypothetical protein